jgi:4-amino-4-deoxy-L-arabinose transferase-like glycosyltransferase
MTAILLIIPFIATVLILRSRRFFGWRGAFLSASLVWGGLVTGITEALGVLRLLELRSLALAWGTVSLLLLLIIFHDRRSISEFLRRVKFDMLPRSQFFLLGCIAFIVAVIGIIAWTAPPNTSDSMTYHLGRVIHWMQNRSVAFYPTHILRQLHQNPWSEFAVLQFQIFLGDERLANFVQWFSMVGSIIGVSLIAKEFKADARGQMFAAVVCATIPMGILQGSSTQTDHVLAFWLVCLAYFVLQFKKDASPLSALGVGVALGLAILTKATAYIFAFPFMAWIGISSIKPLDTKKVALIVLAVVFAFALNFRHYARNHYLYGHPLGPRNEGPQYSYANETFSPASATSSIIRNISLHLGTSIERSSPALDRFLYSLHDVMGTSANDPRTTWGGTVFRSGSIEFDEDSAGNPIHLVLITASLFLYACRPKESDVTSYIFSLLLGFFLFCIYLKWQPWHSRLHLPLFVLFAPVIGLTFSRLRGVRIADFSMAALVVLALPWVFYNTTRPILGGDSIFTSDRTELYFRKQPALTDPYIAAADFLSGLDCTDIGLIIGDKRWEYPLWVLMRERSDQPIRLEHVEVRNESRQLYDESRVEKMGLCAIFFIKPDPPAVIQIGRITYRQVWLSEPITIYTRDPGP